ncbi:restriction endonuclease [Actinocrinis puniceicyclus]|uniref:Restriction endonuclease n=1 Tax=Actinocrinis puniceicyclus TaxID=977794 RepID=A0A8J7WTJ6_9ACTN|nr:restriction endonuclease [Actinocrinis puniceicyclus]MBS2965747.1 restriction endonuclease [Actinocrinis puniceicyclus]
MIELWLSLEPVTRAGCLLALTVAAVLVVFAGEASAGRVGGSILSLLVGGMLIYAARANFKSQRARQLAREQRRALEARQIETYLAMSSREFEHALAYLCVRDGCTDVEVVGRAGDLGADVTARTPVGQKLVIQAKRYAATNTVGSPDLQRFGGTCFTMHGAGVAAVVTTSSFTAPARSYATRMGIRLFDQAALAAWAAGTGPSPWS